MTRFEVHSFEDGRAFREAVEPFLVEREAAHCLHLGVLDGIEAGEWHEAFLALVKQEEDIQLVAMRTPPYDLMVSHAGSVEAVAFLVERLRAAERGAALGSAASQEALGRVGGVRGEPWVVQAFAERWMALGSEGTETISRQWVHACREVVPVSGVPGRLRPVGDADHDLVGQWIHAYHAEAIPHEPHHADASARRWFESPNRSLWLWEVEGEPVAMAGVGNPTPHGVRIRAVFTPPEHRGHGFARAAVAGVTGRQLSLGREACFVFADVTDPVANRVYRSVGYAPEVEMEHVRFVERSFTPGGAVDGA